LELSRYCRAHYPPGSQNVDKQSGASQADARERLEDVGKILRERSKKRVEKTWIGNEY